MGRGDGKGRGAGSLVGCHEYGGLTGNHVHRSLTPALQDLVDVRGARIIQRREAGHTHLVDGHVYGGGCIDQGAVTVTQGDRDFGRERPARIGQGAQRVERQILGLGREHDLAAGWRRECAVTVATTAAATGEQDGGQQGQAKLEKGFHLASPNRCHLGFGGSHGPAHLSS